MARYLVLAVLALAVLARSCSAQQHAHAADRQGPKCNRKMLGPKFNRRMLGVLSSLQNWRRNRGGPFGPGPGPYGPGPFGPGGPGPYGPYGGPGPYGPGGPGPYGPGPGPYGPGGPGFGPGGPGFGPGFGGSSSTAVAQASATSYGGPAFANAQSFATGGKK